MYNRQKLIDLVVEAVNEYPAAANNDAILLEQIWYKQGWRDGDSLYNNLSRVSRPESVTRARRKAHEQGLIKYSSEVIKERTEAFLSERDANSDFVPQAVSWMNDDE